MNYPQSFLEKLRAVKGKRPATIIQHILTHGSITSEEIETLYGYKHPPRAVRDVREQGIPIETFHTKSSEGKSIAAYRFGDPALLTDTISKHRGRTTLSKVLKEALIEKYGARCFVYQETLDAGLLQVDHRVPYEIGGEQGDDIDNYMLLCPSANRAKSWSCEHCDNWNKRDVECCVQCFWAHPEHYTHIAGATERRITLTFTGDEIADYNQLIDKVGAEEAARYIKQLVHDKLNETNYD